MRAFIAALSLQPTPALRGRAQRPPTAHLIRLFCLSPSSSSSSSSMKLIVHIPVLGFLLLLLRVTATHSRRGNSPLPPKHRPRPLTRSLDPFPFPHLHSRNNRPMDLSQCRSPRPVRPPHRQSNAMRLEGPVVSAVKLHLRCRRPHALRRFACGPKAGGK